MLVLLGPQFARAHTEEGIPRSAPETQLPAPAPERQQAAPVVVNGTQLFRLPGIEAYPAKLRARLVAERVERLAQDPDFDPATLGITERNGEYAIVAGESGEVVLVVTRLDAALQGAATEHVAEVFRAHVKAGIESYRHDRQPGVLLRNAMHALFRTIALIGVLFGVFWAFRRLDRILERRLKRRVQDIETRSMSLFRADQAWTAVQNVLRVLRVVIVVALLYVFLNFVLSLFPWTRYAASVLWSVVLTPINSMVQGVIGYLPSLVYLVILFLVTRYALTAFRKFFESVGRERLRFRGFEPEWALPTYRLVRVLVIVLAIVLAYPYIPGSSSDAFKGISILIGVLLSLGSTSMIANLVAGYTMTYRRAFRVGDRIRIGDAVGDVTEVRTLVTHVRSLKNEEIVIPNSEILKREVTNYTTLAATRGLILHTAVGIGYEVPWRQVEAMLRLAAERTGGILNGPKPFVLQTALGDFAVSYELNVYCADEKKAPGLYSELHRNIQDVFNEYGIQIMTPAYERDPAEPKIVPPERWYAAPADARERGGPLGTRRS